MPAIETSSPNQTLEMSLCKDLISAVNQAGLPINPKDKDDPRYQALAFVVSANHEFYGKDCPIVINQLIKDVKTLSLPGGQKAACDVSWRLEQEVNALFKAKVLELSVKDQKLAPTLTAVTNLINVIEEKNAEKHKDGDTVSFSVPGDLIPSWSRDLNVE